MRSDDFVPDDQPPSPESEPQRPSQRGRRARIQINTRDGELAAFDSDDLSAVARKWSRLFRNRRRWAGARSSTQQLNNDSRRQLDDFGIEDAALRSIVGAELVEVSIPYSQDEVAREAREVPWEYMLNAALSSMGKVPPLTVVRHLRRETEAIGSKVPSSADPLKILYVEAVPQILRNWDFTREREGVQANLAAAGEGRRPWNALENPDLQDLKNAVRTESPGAIHFAGFDTRHAARLLGRSDGKPLADGIVFNSRRSGRDRDEVSAERLATVVNLAETAPRLVGFNLYNSAAETAALAVAKGALAAIGFQDVVKDEVAELLFFNFYMHWCNAGFDPLQALIQTQESLSTARHSLTESGMVLWRSDSIVGAELGTRTDSGRGQTRGVATFTWEPSKFPTRRDIFLYDDIIPLERLNYSLLHNNRGLFEKFVLKRAPGVSGRITGLKLRVEIDAGGHAPAFYEQTFEMVDSVMPVHELIRVPLVSELLRTLKHTLRTSIRVSITLGKQSVFHQSYSVDLLAIGEWVDTDAERRLLPSFVLPGDPVVPRVIEAAQRYLVALRDEPGAGFDGYQAVDETSDHSYDVIDLQVRAIWTALQQDFHLKYVNPPPTYANDSQRLRTPSEVVKGRRGTCIDLALLLMACLEYIDIHPVIFLRKGHAFSGYWRSEKAHREFTKGETADSADDPTAGADDDESTAPWDFGDAWFDRIIDLVGAGKLVPVETEDLARNKGFWEAVEGANNDLAKRAEFRSMMDLWMARDWRVSELPILPEYRR